MPYDADLLADYADALAMSQGQSFAGKPMELVQLALKIDPTQWKALAMAGSEAFERKDYKAAADFWQRLQDTAPADSPIRAARSSQHRRSTLAGGYAACRAGSEGRPSQWRQRRPQRQRHRHAESRARCQSETR